MNLSLIMFRVFGIFFILLFLSRTAFSENDFLVIGGKVLELGMKKKEVTAIFTDPFKLLDQGDQIVVLESDGAKARTLGVLIFEKGKLSFAKKQWGEYEGFQMERLGKTLSSLFKNLEDQGYSGAQMTVTTNRELNYSTTSVYLNFGKKQLRIDIYEGRKVPPNISIQEELGEFENLSASINPPLEPGKKSLLPSSGGPNSSSVTPTTEPLSTTTSTTKTFIPSPTVIIKGGPIPNHHFPKPF